MDTIDLAQLRQLEDIEHALANRPCVPNGLPFCERVDCREAISSVRQAMGARLCIECAQAKEQEARRWAPRGQG